MRGCILSASARGATGFQFDSTVLYQPDEPLRARLASAEDLAAHIKRIEASCTAFFAAEKTMERTATCLGFRLKDEMKATLAAAIRL